MASAILRPAFRDRMLDQVGPDRQRSRTARYVGSGVWSRKLRDRRREAVLRSSHDPRSPHRRPAVSSHRQHRRHAKKARPVVRSRLAGGASGPGSPYRFRFICIASEGDPSGTLLRRNHKEGLRQTLRADLGARTLLPRNQRAECCGSWLLAKFILTPAQTTGVHRNYYETTRAAIRASRSEITFTCRFRR